MSEQLQFDFSDGKDRNQTLEDKKNLEKLLDLGKMNPYGTVDKEIFKEQVERKNLAEMRSLAIRVGVTPINNTEKLKEALLRNFDSYVNRHGLTRKAEQSIDPNSKEYKSIQHLLE